MDSRSVNGGALAIALAHFNDELHEPFERRCPAQRHSRRILEETRLPPARLYDLRSAAETLALAAGVPVKV